LLQNNDDDYVDDINDDNNDGNRSGSGKDASSGVFSFGSIGTYYRELLLATVGPLVLVAIIGFTAWLRLSLIQKKQQREAAASASSSASASPESESAARRAELEEEVCVVVRAQHWRAALALSFVCYVGACRLIFACFDTEDDDLALRGYDDGTGGGGDEEEDYQGDTSSSSDGSDGPCFLRIDYGTRCDTPDYFVWRVFACLCVALYPIGVRR
jgi:hypothetical protein